jgi:hypothetical protein
MRIGVPEIRWSPGLAGFVVTSGSDMKLRASVPFSAYLESENPADLFPSTDFRHKDMAVRISFFGDDPLQLQGGALKHFRRLRGFQVEVQGDVALRELTKRPDGWPLLKLIADISNRVLGSIRNFGTVAHLEPLRVSANATDRWLRVLQVEASDDDEPWAAVRAAGTLEDMLADTFLAARERVGELSSADWKLAEEAIQDDLKPGPEREFFTNAVEHLRVGNLRLAVVESVICLEIVLSEWLHHVLPLRGVARNRLKELLSPQMGLSTKLGLLLPLLLSDHDRRFIGEDLVHRTVKLRNGVIHKTGNLPDGVASGAIRQGVGAVLLLATTLADKRDLLRRAPELSNLAAEVAVSCGIPLPNIRMLDRHEYTAWVEFPLAEDVPTDDKLTAVAVGLTNRMEQYDPRFQSRDVHWISFLRGPRQIIAIWVQGKLEKMPKPTPAPPSILKILKILNPQSEGPDPAG